MLELCRTDERDKSRGCLHTMPCKEEEDKVNVSKLNKVNFISASVRGEGLVMARGEILKQVQDDV